MAKRSIMALPEEVIEDILLRLPPAEPASLVRAALVCKLWCRIISGDPFRRRFRKLNGSPPTLGFICNDYNRFESYTTRFVPAASTTAFPTRADHQVRCHALDARHGRVLLRDFFCTLRLTVWDPVTGDRWELPPLSEAWNKHDWNATVLCAASGVDGACDHLDCRDKPFLVVCVGSDRRCIYLSETGSWTESTIADWNYLEHGDAAGTITPALVGNSLYFMLDAGYMLRYNLVTRETSVINSLPAEVAPLKLGDGGIAIAEDDDSILSLWSMETSQNGDVKWTQLRKIDLAEVLPEDTLLENTDSIAFASGFGILVGTSDRLFNIDLESDKVETLCKGSFFHGLFPYRSFYTPVLGSVAAVEGPRADASAA